MTRYCLGFAFNTELTKVVLILKNKPDWQKDLFNGVGGKVESGETYHEAMVREFEEETGVVIPHWTMFCTMTDHNPKKPLEADFFVDCFYTVVAGEKLHECKTQTAEEIFIPGVKDVAYVETIPNIPWLVNLARDKARGINYFIHVI